MKFVYALLLCVCCSFGVFGQQNKVAKIDHLTVEEDNLIHDAQELDKRIEIYVKAIDRRFLALNGGVAPANVEVKRKEKKKDVEQYGALPTGTRAELLQDADGILAEAVRNLDNAAEHKVSQAVLQKSLKILANGCARFVEQLKPLQQSAASDAERKAISDITSSSAEVIAAQNGQNKGDNGN